MRAIVTAENVDIDTPCKVLYARDTRYKKLLLAQNFALSLNHSRVVDFATQSVTCGSNSCGKHHSSGPVALRWPRVREMGLKLAVDLAQTTVTRACRVAVHTGRYFTLFWKKYTPTVLTGLLTTPQLHFMIRCDNTKGGYGEASQEGYNRKLAAAFCKLRGQVTWR